MNQCFTYSISPSISFFAEIHTFSAKEKDSETSLSYFGSRYYSSDLSIWLSVDPMSDKYPPLSPYVYCANNPIKLVDPNGEEIGDYFSMSGEYLGTDGNCDDKVYFVSDESDIDKIKQNNKAGKTTDTENVNIKITTTKCDIWASEDVYRRTKKNGGYCEEATFDCYNNDIFFLNADLQLCKANLKKNENDYSMASIKIMTTEKLYNLQADRLFKLPGENHFLMISYTDYDLLQLK